MGAADETDVLVAQVRMNIPRPQDRAPLRAKTQKLESMKYPNLPHYPGRHSAARLVHAAGTCAHKGTEWTVRGRDGQECFRICCHCGANQQWLPQWIGPRGKLNRARWSAWAYPSYIARMRERVSGETTR